jgi:sugar phosphate isomerase/epimerase
MQLGISTFTYGWAVGVATDGPNKQLNGQLLLNQAGRMGIRLVQVGDNCPLHELTTDQWTAFHERAVREGIRLEVGARGMTENHLHRYIALTQRLKSRLLRFVIDGPTYEPPADRVVGLLREAVSALEQAGVTLGIENHDRLMAREFAHIVEQVSSERVGICLDTANSLGAGEGLAEVVRTLAPYTVNLHLKDVGIRRLPHQQGFQIDGRIAGRGMLNIPWLVEAVACHGRCQTAVLEQWVPPEADDAATVAKEAVWAEESLTYLKETNLFSF